AVIVGQMVVLYAGGAIGPKVAVPGIHVAMPDALAGYILPAALESKDLAMAVRASMSLLDFAPDRITVPLLGAVYRAVLVPADYALHLCGQAGVSKTELAALAQQHHGAGLNARHL